MPALNVVHDIIFNYQVKRQKDVLANVRLNTSIGG